VNQDVSVEYVVFLHRGHAPYLICRTTVIIVPYFVNNGGLSELLSQVTFYILILLNIGP